MKIIEHGFYGLDPNETAKDMTDRYKMECSSAKVRPIAKLLEQLEVSPNLHVLLAKFNFWVHLF